MRGRSLQILAGALLVSLFSSGKAHSDKASTLSHDENVFESLAHISEEDLTSAFIQEQAFIVNQNVASKQRFRPFRRQQLHLEADDVTSDAIVDALTAKVPEYGGEYSGEYAGEYSGEYVDEVDALIADVLNTERQEPALAPTLSPVSELKLPPSPSTEALKQLDPSSVEELGEEMTEAVLHLKPGQDVSAALKEFMKTVKAQHLKEYQKLKEQHDAQESVVAAAEQKLTFMEKFTECVGLAEQEASKPPIDEAALAERDAALSKRETELLEHESKYKDEVRLTAQQIKEQQDALNQQKADLEAREKKIAEEENGLSREQLESERNELATQVEDLTKHNQELSDQLAILKSQLEAKDESITEKDAKIKEKDEKIAEMVKNVEEMTVRMQGITADCVTKSEHNEVVKTRDSLAEDKKRLLAEQVKLAQDQEDLRQAKEAEAQAKTLLEEQKATLQQDFDEQTEELKAVEKERDLLESKVEDLLDKGGVNEEVQALQEKLSALAGDNLGDDPKCNVHTECSSCTADARCGWCASSKTCLTGNAFFVDGSCPLSDWNWMFCRGADCKTHTGCRSCVADPKCGACNNNGRLSCLPLDNFDIKRNASDQTLPGKCPLESWTYDVEPHGLTFLTLNVWGEDTTNSQVRGRALLKTIREANADFVALQEVADWFLEQLRACDWVSKYYQSDYQSGRAPGGLYILSKYPLESISYFEETQPGQTNVEQRGRVLVVVPKVGSTYATQSRKLAVATTALDWRSADSRVNSMDFIFSVLSQFHNVALMGDFNFDTNALPETQHVPTDFVDVWPLLHPKKFGFTWNPELNPLAKIADPASSPSRIDRIFISSVHWVPRSIEMIGNEVVSEDAPQLRPSSHFGLLATASIYDLYC